MGNKYKQKTFSNEFNAWVKTDSREPYASGEDGSAMRVSPIGYYAETIEECLELAKISAEVTHNGEEGIRGAQAVAAAIFYYRNGKTKEEVKQLISEMFPMYDLNRKIDDIRPGYKFKVDCDKVVPESILCFLEGDTYEETVKLAISLGGDADTMACISGSIAAARMEVSEEYAKYALGLLPPELKDICDDFYRKFKDKTIVYDLEEEKEGKKEPQDAIPAPLMPSKAKTKVTVAKKRKTPQEVKKSAEPSNEAKTNFELTEENKASMEEMLSIKSGELLEDVLNK